MALTANELIFDAYKQRTEQLKKALAVLRNLVDALEANTGVADHVQFAREYLLTEAPLALLETG